MANWSFLTNHARALVCIAHDPGVRLRDIAAALEITERSAYAIVTDLTDDGYIVKEKEGRRNRYHIQGNLPLRETVGRHRTIGEVLDLLTEAGVPHGRSRARVRSRDSLRSWDQDLPSRAPREAVGEVLEAKGLAGKSAREHGGTVPEPRYRPAIYAAGSGA